MVGIFGKKAAGNNNTESEPPAATTQTYIGSVTYFILREPGPLNLSMWYAFKRIGCKYGSWLYSLQL
jgi:hypothetical protein